MAERLGVSTDEMTAFRLAAAHAGGEVDILARASERLSSIIGAASLNDPKAIQHLHQLGLNAKELADQSKPEQLVAFGKALEGIGNASQQDFLAKQFSGKNFGAMKLMLKELAENSNALKAEGRGLGLGVTPEQMKSVNEAHKATEQLGLAWEGVENKVALALAPNKTSGAKQITRLLGGQADHFSMTDILGEGEAKAAGAKGILLGASEASPHGADQGSVAAFEIIAAAMQANPVVEKLDETNAKLDEQLVLQNEFIDRVKKAETGTYIP